MMEATAVAEQPTPPSVSANDRFMFTLFLAGILHASIILGVGFTSGSDNPVTQTLEITLAAHRSEEAPEEADFLAQANQLGSGSLEEKAEVSTTEIADFSDNVIREIQPLERSSSRKPEPVQPDYVITENRSRLSVSSKADEKPPEDQSQLETSNTMAQKSMEIASLEAQLREMRQASAKRPRKRQLTAASTKQARDAAYLDAWRSKVELVGNRDYGKLNVGGLYGSLQLMVAINANGTINTIRVLESSGYKKLDDAAVRVVRKASPYEPFPEEIRKDTDVLEIIRTWRFEEGEYLSSY